MAIKKIFGFLVYPGKGQETQHPVNGTDIPLQGGLYGMLQEVYDKSDTECNIDITFTPTEGQQENARRDQVIGFVRNPGLPTATILAEKLQEVTTKRSGRGLVFFIYGKEGPQHKVLISRFPAERGIMVDEN